MKRSLWAKKPSENKNNVNQRRSGALTARFRQIVKIDKNLPHLVQNANISATCHWTPWGVFNSRSDYCRSKQTLVRQHLKSFGVMLTFYPNTIYLKFATKSRICTSGAIYFYFDIILFKWHSNFLSLLNKKRGESEKCKSTLNLRILYNFWLIVIRKLNNATP